MRDTVAGRHCEYDGLFRRAAVNKAQNAAALWELPWAKDGHIKGCGVIIAAVGVGDRSSRVWKPGDSCMVEVIEKPSKREKHSWPCLTLYSQGTMARFPLTDLRVVGI